jgi:hypothetical protein
MNNMPLGKELLALLRAKADAEWEYYNPYFLMEIADKIEEYYNIRDDVVDEWIGKMFSA